MTVQVFNRHQSAGLNWQVLGSHNARDWQIIYADAAILEVGQATRTAIAEPWNFIKAQIRSATGDSPSTVDIYATLRR